MLNATQACRQMGFGSTQTLNCSGGTQMQIQYKHLSILQME
jgi:hypothetical protein